MDDVLSRKVPFFFEIRDIVNYKSIIYWEEKNKGSWVLDKQKHRQER